MPHPMALLQAIEDGFPYPIKMMWIQSSNTLSCPSQDAPRVMKAMQNIPFIVNADPYVTPTSVALADILLPVAMSAERNSARTWWSPCRAMVKVADYYEAKSDEQIILEYGPPPESRGVRAVGDRHRLAELVSA